MCNLYSNLTSQEAMRQLFDVTPDMDRLGNADPLRAIYPKHKAPIVSIGESGDRMLVSAQWGLPPVLDRKNSLKEKSFAEEVGS